MNEPGPQLASQGRRLAGAVLDGAIFVLTLGIGWVIWYLIAARHGQSPAKRLLGMRVIREDGAAATLGWMLIRDLAVRVIAFGAVDRLLVAALGEGTGGAFTSLLFMRGRAVVRVGRQPAVPVGQDRAHPRRRGPRLSFWLRRTPVLIPSEDSPVVR